MTDPLVTADWLAANLDRVVILDATYLMPPDPAGVRAAFEAVHIPGAQPFEIDAVSHPDTPLPHMLQTPSVFAAAAAALGIDGTRPVVVYDRSLAHFSAPRVWLTLSVFGVPEVRVLDGGLRLWQAGGHPVASGPARAAPVAPRDWTPDLTRIVTGAEIAGLVAGGSTPILDARPAARFRGQAPEPRPGLATGHMPGAVSLPFDSLTGPDGRFADAARLAALFAGKTGAGTVATCGSGMTAATLVLGLARIGQTARLYDASWAEWGQGRLGPIVIGD